MFTTQTMTLSGLAGAALLVATPAMARPHSTVTVANQWSAPVTVEIDGHRVDTLHGNRTERYSVRPGMHTVTVRAKNGTLLESETHWLRPHRNGFVTVDIPRTTLTVTNTGHRPMFVSGLATATYQGGGLWIAPGRSHTTSVPAGNVVLTGSVEGRRGMRTVDQETIWAEPGRTSQVAMGAPVAAPSQLVVTNPEPFPVTLVVDGVSHGKLRPGASIALDVRPGRHDIDAFHHRGRVVFDETVRVGHGTSTLVSLCGRITTQPAQDRPGRRGPRPTTASSTPAYGAHASGTWASSGYTYWTR